MRIAIYLINYSVRFLVIGFMFTLSLNVLGQIVKNSSDSVCYNSDFYTYLSGVDSGINYIQWSDSLIGEGWSILENNSFFEVKHFNI